MNRSMKRCFLLVLGLILIITGVPAGAEPGAEEVFAEQMLVGRLSHVEGQVLRFDPEENDWIPAVEDTPFGLEDVLYSDRGARAEIIAPNNTWVRIGSDTRIQLVELNDALTHVRMSSGIARFYNKGSYPVIKGATPYGSVTAPAETCFEVHVTLGKVEVKSLKGTVYFTQRETNKKYEVIAGAASLVSDDRSIAAGKGYGDPVWEVWNRERDALWAGRMNAHVKSLKYMPPGLHDHAYLLDENGVWEPVYYGGATYYFWRPIYVGPGWAPFTVGRWSLWYGESTWLSYEPFGYVTHHYGNWIFAGGFWYWAPPVPRLRAHVRAPLLNIAFAWYPGRVAWIHFGSNIGWIPLAPGERYYCHHRWSPEVVIFKGPLRTKSQVSHYRYYRHAVIIDRARLRDGHYNNHGAVNIDRDYILKKSDVTPSLDRETLRRYPDKDERHESVRIDRRLRPEHEGVRSENRSPITAPAPRIKPPAIKGIFRDTPVAEPKQSKTEARTSAAKRVTGPGGPSAVSPENPRPKTAADRPGGPESKERRIPRRTGEAARPEGPKLPPKPVMDRYQGEERSRAQRKIQGPKRALPSGTRESQMSKVPGMRINAPEATALSERGQKMSGSRMERRERERVGHDVQSLGRPGPAIQQPKRASGYDRKDLETNRKISTPQTRQWGAAPQGKGRGSSIKK